MYGGELGTFGSAFLGGLQAGQKMDIANQEVALKYGALSRQLGLEALKNQMDLHKLAVADPDSVIAMASDPDVMARMHMTPAAMQSLVGTAVKYKSQQDAMKGLTAALSRGEVPTDTSAVQYAKDPAQQKTLLDLIQANRERTAGETFNTDFQHMLQHGDPEQGFNTPESAYQTARSVANDPASLDAYIKKNQPYQEGYGALPSASERRTAANEAFARAAVDKYRAGQLTLPELTSELATRGVPLESLKTIAPNELLKIDAIRKYFEALNTKGAENTAMVIPPLAGAMTPEQAKILPTLIDTTTPEGSAGGRLAGIEGVKAEAQEAGRQRVPGYAANLDARTDLARSQTQVLRALAPSKITDEQGKAMLASMISDAMATGLARNYAPQLNIDPRTITNVTKAREVLELARQRGLLSVNQLPALPPIRLPGVNTSPLHSPGVLPVPDPMNILGQ